MCPTRSPLNLSRPSTLRTFKIYQKDNIEIILDCILSMMWFLKLKKLQMTKIYLLIQNSDRRTNAPSTFIRYSRFLKFNQDSSRTINNLAWFSESFSSFIVIRLTNDIDCARTINCFGRWLSSTLISNTRLTLIYLTTGSSCFWVLMPVMTISVLNNAEVSNSQFLNQDILTPKAMHLSRNSRN